jgi:UPF0755 protein
MDFGSDGPGGGFVPPADDPQNIFANTAYPGRPDPLDVDFSGDVPDVSDSDEDSEYFDYVDGDDDDYDGEPRRRHNSALRTALTLLVTLAVLAGLVFTAVHFGGKLYGYITGETGEDYDGGDAHSDVTVTIVQGASASMMAKTLFEADVVKSEDAFISAVNKDQLSFSKIQAATYGLRTKLPAAEALTMLANPDNIKVNWVTVPEGMRNSKLFAFLSEKMSIPVEDFQAAAADPAKLGVPAWAQKNNGEGFYFPDTYDFGKDPTAEYVLTAMVARMNDVLTELDFESKAASMGHDPYQVLIVASIIEKEGAFEEFASDIAQVIYNRLNAGMELQMDSTSIYAADVDGNVWTSDDVRANPSPYNTYMHAGLPPGPISNPARVALNAALNPTSGNYLFFTVVNPETHETKFATDDAGHQANVNELRAWCGEHPDVCGTAG